MDRNLQILGLAKKAGLLAIGAEDTVAASKVGKAKLIVSACDASESALRRAQFCSQIGCALHIEAPFSSFQLGTVSGRGSPSTVSILDTGLAARFLEGLAQTDPKRFSGAASLLANEARAKKQTSSLSKKKRSTITDKRRTVQ